MPSIMPGAAATDLGLTADELLSEDEKQKRKLLKDKQAAMPNGILSPASMALFGSGVGIGKGVSNF